MLYCSFAYKVTLLLASNKRATMFFFKTPPLATFACETFSDILRDIKVMYDDIQHSILEMCILINVSFSSEVRVN